MKAQSTIPSELVKKVKLFLRAVLLFTKVDRRCKSFMRTWLAHVGQLFSNSRSQFNTLRCFWGKWPPSVLRINNFLPAKVFAHKWFFHELTRLHGLWKMWREKDVPVNEASIGQNLLSGTPTEWRFTRMRHSLHFYFQTCFQEFILSKS